MKDGRSVEARWRDLPPGATAEARAGELARRLGDAEIPSDERLAGIRRRIALGRSPRGARRGFTFALVVGALVVGMTLGLVAHAWIAPLRQRLLGRGAAPSAATAPQPRARVRPARPEVAATPETAIAAAIPNAPTEAPASAAAEAPKRTTAILRFGAAPGRATAPIEAAAPANAPAEAPASAAAPAEAPMLPAAAPGTAAELPVRAAAAPGTAVALARPALPRRRSPATVAAPGERPQAPEPPREAAALATAIRKLRLEGDARGALLALDEHAAAFPAGELAAEADLVRVEALLALGEQDAALRLLDARAEANPRARQALLVRGELRAAAGRCAEAARDLARVLSRPPRDALDERALFARASCRTRLHDFPAARADLEALARHFAGGARAAQAAETLRALPPAP